MVFQRVLNAVSERASMFVREKVNDAIELASMQFRGMFTGIFKRGIKCVHGNYMLEITNITTLEQLDSGLRTLRLSISTDNGAGVKSVGLGLFQMRHGSQIDLLKLTTPTHCLWIDIPSLCLEQGFDLPPQLCSFLERSDITFVGVGIKHSVEALYDSYGILCRNFVDLGASRRRSRAYGFVDSCTIDMHLSFKVGIRMVEGCPYFNDMRDFVDDDDDYFFGKSIVI